MIMFFLLGVARTGHRVRVLLAHSVVQPDVVFYRHLLLALHELHRLPRHIPVHVFLHPGFLRSLLLHILQQSGSHPVQQLVFTQHDILVLPAALRHRHRELVYYNPPTLVPLALGLRNGFMK